MSMKYLCLQMKTYEWRKTLFCPGKCILFSNEFDMIWEGSYLNINLLRGANAPHKCQFIALLVFSPRGQGFIYRLFFQFVALCFVLSLYLSRLCCAAASWFWFSRYQLLNNGFSTDSRNQGELGWIHLSTDTVAFSDRCVLGFLCWFFFLSQIALRKSGIISSFSELQCVVRKLWQHNCGVHVFIFSAFHSYRKQNKCLPFSFQQVWKADKNGD